jgi:asparagine synthase (glutamine-hydrolysing)
VAPWICSDFVARHPAYRRLLTAAEGRWHWLPSIKDGFQTISSFARELSYFPPSRMEKRYPFFDQTLLEFLISIPTDQLVRPGHRRSLMRRALAGLLPAEIESRRTKASTGRCVAITCEKHCHTVENLLIAPLCSELGFVDARRVREAFLAAKNGRLPDYFRLIRALSLEIWLRDTVASGVVSVGTAR